jgi:hypothetical protein
LPNRNGYRLYRCEGFVLSFDLRSVDYAEIEQAELVLQVRSSGLGFSALAPDSRFAVYGMEADEWDEATLTWDLAP